ncbi:hypothetical protein [Methylobacterium sp. CM6247]
MISAKYVSVSLRTREPQEAKVRQVVAVAYLEAVWRSVREGPKGLILKEALALAGEVYCALADTLEDDPGTAERWLRAEVGNLKAKVGSSDVPH